jgi:soluble lytic murein transglycosylase-like protein
LIVDEMKKRVSIIIGVLGIGIGFATSSIAENKIQAFRTPDGRTIYTNMVDNPSTPQAKATRTLAPSQSKLDPVHALIDSIAQKHGIDPALVRAMIRAESNFNRWAVSSKGARGLMQLIPETGARYGVQDFFDPRQNIEGGVLYMKFLLQKFHGDLDLSLAAYNAGENLVERLGRIPQIAETRDYVRKVRANYGKSAPAVALNTLAPAQPQTPETYRMVDERGVVHFYNTAPPR